MPADAKKNTPKTTGDKKPKTAPKGGVQKQKKVKETKETLYKNLFIARPKIMGIGQNLLPEKDLTRFVRWPKNVILQRQRRIMSKRLKVPPSVNQFNRSANKPLAARIFKLLEKYRPEHPKARRDRLRAASKERVKGAHQKPANKPITVVAGVNEVVNLIEKQKAQLVVLAHDVTPLELVLFIPTLCKKLGIPYAIVKSKSRLGQLVHLKNTAVVALTEVRKDDREELSQLLESIRGSFNERYAEQNRHWGGLKLSRRSLEARKKKLEVA
ncbi:ribosomal protein L7 [Acrasis kona]|uniref:60S ribosomal protein L7a n=1 Tax=Acrasis kona TaxID=1008807 RepID=A0AAW2Z440_9EUKA